MRPPKSFSTRRDFLQSSAAATISAAIANSSSLPELTSPHSKETAPLPPQDDTHHAARRKELWSLLGDLPWQHKPGPPKLISKEEHEDYVLERLVLDLNGIEPVPALLLIPR